MNKEKNTLIHQLFSGFLVNTTTSSNYMININNNVFKKKSLEFKEIFIKTILLQKKKMIFILNLESFN
jgi:hypothetical protein